MNFPKIYRRFAFVAVGVLLVGLFPAAAMAQAGETFSFAFTVHDDPGAPVSPIVAGTELDVVVTAHSPSAPLVADEGYTGTVSFARHDGDVTSIPSCVLAPGDLGVCAGPEIDYLCVRDATFRVVGAQHLTATDGEEPASSSESGDVAVSHAVIASLTLVPADLNPITAGVGSKAYTALAEDSSHNSWDATDEMTLSIDGGVGTGSCEDVTHTCTSTLAGPRIVTGTDKNDKTVTGTSTLNVNHGGATKLLLTPPDSSVDADHSQAYQVQTADDYYNPIAYVTTVATLGITGTGTSCNNTTAHSCTSTKAGGPYSVTASYDSMSAGTDLTVTAGDANHLVLNPTTTTINADQIQVYTVETVDDHGNHVAWVTNSATFDIDAPGTCDNPSNSCTAATASGPLTVTGHYLGYTGTALLTVTPGAATHLVLSPSSQTISTDQAQPYSVVSVDANGNTVATVTGSAHLTITGPGTS